MGEGSAATAIWAWPVFSLILLPLLVECLLLWPGSRRRRSTGSIPRAQLRRAHFAASLTSLICWCAALISFDWPATVKSWVPINAYGVTLVVACLPLMLGIALAAIPIARTVGYRSPSALKGEVWQSLRPNLFLLIPFAVIHGLEEWISLNPDHFLQLPLIGQGILILLPAVLIVSLAPWLFEKVLRSVPFPEGPLKNRSLELCQKAGLRDVLPRIWRTGTRPVANAMMTGLFPYQRRVFVTDVLLQSMTPDELDAVLAHELAHARRYHLWIYIAFAAAVLMWAISLDQWISELIITGIAPLLFVIFFFFAFRFISHHMEHEADLFSESLCEKPGSIIQALLQLRRGGKRWREKSSWRHPSILDRIRVLHTHREDDQFRNTFDSKGRWIRRLTIAALISGAGLIAWQYRQAPAAEAWQIHADEAIGLIHAIDQRQDRPWPNPERLVQLLKSSEELLLKAVAELRELDPLHPMLAPILLQLAEIYDQLEEPWNALSCRLQARS